MNSRDLFHAAASGEKTLRPPLWLMRQAGRYLPEYRELKAKHGFLGIVKTPELALEAALQPMRRFDFDCSILFSDILVVAEALGFPYNFKDGGGIILKRKIQNIGDINSIPTPAAIPEKLGYVKDALKLLRKNLPQKAVVGFCAAPFTLAAYMIEGESAPNFPKFQKFLNEQPKLFSVLMEKLSESLSEYAAMQIECGVDGFQIFDSHAGLTETNKYEELSAKFTKNIFASIGGRARTILFANNMAHRFGEVAGLGADVYSIETGVKLSELKQKWQAPYSVQGNLNPKLLSEATPEIVAEKVKEIIGDMHEIGGHIFNLGHGILPDAKIENIEILCETVKNYSK